jgi:hypothetical protein
LRPDQKEGSIEGDTETAPHRHPLPSSSEGPRGRSLADYPRHPHAVLPHLAADIQLPSFVPQLRVRECVSVVCVFVCVCV